MCANIMFTYGFDILLQVQIHNDPIEPEHTNELQQSEQLELLGLYRVQENLKEKNVC